MITNRILRNRQQQLHFLSRYITTTSNQTSSKNTYTHLHLPKLDSHLKQVFDNQKYFNNFNKSSSSYNIRTGLFKNEYLTSANGLIEFSKTSLQNAKDLVDDMLQSVSNSPQGKLYYIKKLDQLSDLLCRVIDVAEFIRFVHPSNKFQNSAQKVHEIMFEYMNQLNTNVELYENLKVILQDKAILEKLSDEEIKVGEYLKQDFERSGIHMDPETRNNFVNITQNISLLGSSFNNDINILQDYEVYITEDEYEKLPVHFKNQVIVSNNSKYMIPINGSLPYQILLTDNESIRKKVWLCLHNAKEDQIKKINKFITYRGILSKMLGYQSFSHYQLEHKMAKNPKNVLTFLHNLQKSLQNVNIEMKNLIKYKTDKELSDDQIIEELKPWDRDYLLTKLQEHEQTSNEDYEVISQYFTIGNVIAGFSKLCKQLFNISLVPVPTQIGETWDNTRVRKIKAVDHSNDKTLGFIYLDLWSTVQPSHFTIVCSRRLNVTESREEIRKQSQIIDDYQLPVISVICNFDNGTKKSNSLIGRFAGVDNTKPTLLTLDQVDTIFHEMGHAMHSMIGRTELHNLSGTRCSTDFVELPSVLMESFSKDTRVLSEIGYHYETNEKIPKELIEKFSKSRNSLEACEAFMQSKMAILDQYLHNEDIVNLISENKLDQIDSTKIYHKIEADLKVFADKWSTWHGKFPHLFSYGAVYYSYLLDRAIAEKVYNYLFKEDPWNSKNGLKYKNSILKWGGIKDPWECLADCLDNKELSKGDSRAMEIIGQDSNLQS
ncbi:unnamed protein product [Candida verbasci]|uniref:Mitochondrial intermediate peptidase n=1 Tax=Candida verbasci TaxID=1227364 RepID=A0A9W4XCP0_9ASCO|nr:unnamed protein product [Candida verbasci]